jgi:hypothetical protein
LTVDLAQVLFKDDTFQWARLENLITLAADVPSGANSSLDLSETVVDGAKVFFSDEYIRNALILALTQDDRLHVEEVRVGDSLCPWLSPSGAVLSRIRGLRRRQVRIFGGISLLHSACTEMAHHVSPCPHACMCLHRWVLMCAPCRGTGWAELGSVCLAASLARSLTGKHRVPGR